MGDKDKYLVDGLAHEMEELKLPPPVTRSLHETLCGAVAVKKAKG